MVWKFIVPIALGVVLASGSSAIASDYRPDEFFTLDLSSAALLPRPLGPEAHFESVPVQARTDQAADQKASPAAEQKQATEQKQPDQAVAATQPEAKSAVPRRIAMGRVRIAKPLVKPHGPARMKLAHRHGNPLDAQAMDTRIQTWPCKPGNGGICAWR